VGKDGRLIAIHWGYRQIANVVINYTIAINWEGNNIAAFAAVLDYIAKYNRDNSYKFGNVNVIVKEGTSIKVEVVGEEEKANGFKGLVFT